MTFLGHSIYCLHAPLAHAQSYLFALIHNLLFPKGNSTEPMECTVHKIDAERGGVPADTPYFYMNGLKLAEVKTCFFLQ